MSYLTLLLFLYICFETMSCIMLKSNKISVLFCSYPGNVMTPLRLCGSLTRILKNAEEFIFVAHLAMVKTIYKKCFET